MGQTLAIWKWRPGWPFRSDARVMRALGRDRAPFALARFDAQGFAGEIAKRFGGGGDDMVFSVDVCDFTGQRANWLILGAGWGTGPEVDELVKMCEARGLHIYAA